MKDGFLSMANVVAKTAVITAPREAVGLIDLRADDGDGAAFSFGAYASLSLKEG